jgi:DNA invertase Pin-like site-specific DNA recombinase
MRKVVIDSKLPPKCLAYCRASTSKQEMSTEVQKGLIAQRAATLGLPVPTWYVDEETSGRLHVQDRPAGKRLLEDIRPGDTLIISKLDRFSRNLSDLLTVVDGFQKRKIRFVICDWYGAEVDLETPHGMLFFQQLGAFAEFERRMIGERTRESHRIRKANGHRTHAAAGLGFRWVNRGTRDKPKWVRVPNPKEQQLMRDVVRWFDAGWGADEIRQHLEYSMFDGVKGYPNINNITGKASKTWSVGKIHCLQRAGRTLLAEEAARTSQAQTDTNSLTSANGTD